MRATTLLLLLALLPGAAPAGELLSGFEKALATDPAYQAAKAEYEVNKLTSERAGRAYWPELGFRAGERSEVAGYQATIQLAQPVFDADRYATWRGAEALALRASATMQQRGAELLQRHYKAVMDVVRTREQLRLNEAKVDALARQAQAAERGLALGTGTKTDVYDAQVRLSSARADTLTLRATLDAAERQYKSQTDSAASANAFALVRTRRTLALPPLAEILERAETANPLIIAAVQAERLAELDVTRKRGAFLPRVNAIARQSKVQNEGNNTFVGLAFELPLQSGSLIDVSAANASLVKATEEVRVARVNARLEAQRLHELVASGRFELPIRLEAIEAARLGLEATEKSFRGGVRSQVDVLNSIQIVFLANDNYVAAALAVGANFVALHAVVDTPSREVLEQLEKFLF